MLDFYYRYFKRLNEDVLDEDLYCSNVSVWLQKTKVESIDKTFIEEDDHPCKLKHKEIENYATINGV